MHRGLFGKIQSKRDFIAVATPRTFLSVWEPWIQTGVAASRERLGPEWQSAFLTAPIWRYWLGADICGQTVLGAIMSSTDGVGRCYPLTVAMFAAAAESIPPPELDPQDEWFVAAEDFLLSTLDQSVEFEKVTRGLEALPNPSNDWVTTNSREMALSQGTALGAPGRQDFTEAFSAARRIGYEETYAATSCWWTIGGNGYERRVLMALRMPDPQFYAGMITGVFANTEPQGA